MHHVRSMACIQAFIAIVCTSALRSGAHAAPWPMFGHDPQHTGRTLVDTSSNPGTLKWVFTMPNGNPVLSSPAVGADGTIYIGTGVATSTNDYLYAINSDGTQKWAFRIWQCGLLFACDRPGR
jgi:hypothetical protein